MWELTHSAYDSKWVIEKLVKDAKCVDGPRNLRKIAYGKIASSECKQPQLGLWNINWWPAGQVKTLWREFKKIVKFAIVTNKITEWTAILLDWTYSKGNADTNLDWST